MSDPDVEREEEANQERKARGDEAERDTGLLGTAGRVFDGILSPENRDADDADEVEAQRRATDAEERG